MTAILITGMHRTGSSMVAQVLHRAGLYLGPASHLLQPAPDNPEGFFENAGFVRLSDDLLEACGGAWDHLPPAPPMAADDPRVAHLVSEARALIDEVGRTGIWGWKDPRGSLTVRFWQDLIEDLKVVVCLRHPLEVAMSLKKRNNTSYLHSLSLWEGYYSTLLAAVPPEQRIVTHYDNHAINPVEETRRLVEFAGLPVDNIEAAAATHKADLRHQHLDVDPAAAGVSARLIELYEQLSAEAGYTPTHDTERTEGAVHRDTVDLIQAKSELERRGRHIASLERQRDTLNQRVADLESAGRADLLDQLNARLNWLEDAVHEPRYWIEGLADRHDADVVRGCRELVRELPHRHRTILVVGKGDPLLLDLYGRPASNFPSDDAGQFPGFTFSDGAAAIAHLEALRAGGAGYLLVPHTARWWLTHYASFTDHLVDHYPVVAESAGIGVVFDLNTRRTSNTGWPRSLSGVLDRLASHAQSTDVSVLDWSTGSHADRLPGRNVFTPPTNAATLPYLADSIDVVLLDAAAAADPEVTAEAARVARLAVLTVTSTERPEVTHGHAIHLSIAGSTRPVIKMVPSVPHPDEAWQQQVAEALADEAVVEFCVDLSDLADADVIAVIDPGVVPLSGILDAVRSALDAEGVGAVAGKLLAGNGSLLGAGTTVFADGSTAGIAAGSFDVATPWHEYLRDTCGGEGLLWLNPSTLNKIDARLVTEPEPDPMVWSAAVWASGLRVRYQPAAAAVATRPREAGPAHAALIAEAFSRSLDARPPRPHALDDRAWRQLVATDDVEGGWR